MTTIEHKKDFERYHNGVDYYCSECSNLDGYCDYNDNSADNTTIISITYYTYETHI